MITDAVNLTPGCACGKPGCPGPRPWLWEGVPAFTFVPAAPLIVQCIHCGARVLPEDTAYAVGDGKLLCETCGDSVQLTWDAAGVPSVIDDVPTVKTPTPSDAELLEAARMWGEVFERLGNGGTK